MAATRILVPYFDGFLATERGSSQKVAIFSENRQNVMRLAFDLRRLFSGRGMMRG
jgi:hypothetical protein